ncbi:MAG: type II toxin-antitoxin system RelE/ParE family toxin [Planctomycetota bacterium]
MNYTVIIPPAVDSQLLDAALYISEDAPDRALTWYDETIAKLHSLSDLPDTYPVSDRETAAAGYDIRKMTIGNYHAFYQVDHGAKRVEVLAFRHAARQPEDFS